MKKRYCIYLRKSRPDTIIEVAPDGSLKEAQLSTEETLERHKETLLALAKSMHIQVDVIYEEVVSGSTIAERPEVRRMLAAVARNEYAGVLVYNVTRLARGEARDQGNILSIFKHTNTLIITPRKTYDAANDKADEKFLEFEFFMSHQEYSMIKERLTDGKFYKIQQGQFLATTAPYGYDKVSIGKTKTLRRNEFADVVRYMFDMADPLGESLGKRTIALRLIREGVLTPTGKTNWSHYTIGRILTNEAYIGKVRCDLTSIKYEIDPDTLMEVKTRKKVSEANADGYQLFDGLHEGIIEPEQFYRVQAAARNAPRINTFQELINPLAELLRCPKCGMLHKRVKSRNGSRYSHQYSLSCKMKSVPADAVIDAFIDHAKATIRDFDINVKDSQENLHGKWESELASAKRRVSDSESRITALWDRLDSGSVSEDLFNQRMSVLDERYTSAKKHLQAMMVSEPAVSDKAEMVATLHKCIGIINEPGDKREVNAMLRGIIDHIDLWVDGGFNEHNITMAIFFK